MTVAKKKLKKLSQRQIADGLVVRISEHLLDPIFEEPPVHLDGLAMLHSNLDHLLDDAQNPPPRGKADGSIDADRYLNLREVQRALQRLVLTVEHFNMLDEQ